METKPQTYSGSLAQQVQGAFTEAQIQAAIKGGIIPKEVLNDRDSIALFFHQCAAAGADPLLKQAYLVPFNGKYACSFDYKFIRGKCDATGEWGGQDEILYNGGLTLSDCMQKGIKQPTTATATIYRIINGLRFGTTFTVSWAEYGSSRSVWATKPFHMLGKVAIAHCTRAAFPAATEGLYIMEELDHVASPIKDVSYTEVDLMPEALEALAKCETPDQVFDLEKKYQSLNSKTEWTDAIAERLESLVNEMEGSEL